MLRLFTFLFGVSLIALLAFVTIARRSESTAFWILTRQNTNQLRNYNYVLSFPDGRSSRIIASAADTRGNANWFIDWIPDSDTIFYLDEDIYALDVRSSETRRIIETHGAVISFSTLLSPKGDWMLLELRNSVNTQLYRVNTDGTSAELIADILSVTSNMTWSSDGGTVYFINFSHDQFRPLASDGRSITEVTWSERFEQISPDGAQRAFYRQELPGVWYVEDMDTGEIGPLTPPEAQYRMLDWLPNGWILIEELQDRISPDFDNTQRFYRIRPDGSELSPLFTASPGYFSQIAPFWTDEWLYINSSEGAKESLYRVNIETGQSELVIDSFSPFTIDELVDLYDGTARIVRLIGDWIIWRTSGDDTHFMQSRLDGTETHEIYDLPDGARTPKLISSHDNQWLYVTFLSGRSAWSVDRIHLQNRTAEHVFNNHQRLLVVSPIVDLAFHPYWCGLAVLVILTKTVLIFFK